MKKLAIAALAVFSLAGQAFSADFGTKKPGAPVAPIMASYNWTGFYVGIQGGYGFGGDVRHRQGATISRSIDLNGGLVGGTIGYNHQINQFVIGLEGDYAWSDFRGTDTNCAAPGCRTTVRSFGTARARLGYAIDRFMPYVTGGVAFGDVRGSVAAFSGSSFRAGWTIGGGVEAAVWRNVTVKAEYLYYDLGRFTYTTIPVPSVSTNAKGHIVRAGVNYRF